jgi:Chalcone isomerase-like
LNTALLRAGVLTTRLAWLIFGAACTSLALAQPVPGELRALLPAGQLAGRAKLSVWGFQIYNASLWVTPGFKSAAFAEHAFALDLAYLRDFSGEDIAKRSMAEMRRQGPVPDEKAAAWERQMREAFPSVRDGDRITGINRPGLGATFLVNGKAARDIRDPEFARVFFGIWLSHASSEPRMRQELLSQVLP